MNNVLYLIVWFHSPDLGEFARAWEVDSRADGGELYRELRELHRWGKLEPAYMRGTKITFNDVRSRTPGHCPVIDRGS